MVSEARMELHVDAELAALANEYAYLAELGAEMIAESVRDEISISDIPAAAGEPPHSKGPYRDSWKSGKAKRRKDVITAFAFSMAQASNGEPLAVILEDGQGPTAPHPHWRAAAEHARRDLEREVERVNTQLRAGG